MIFPASYVFPIENGGIPASYVSLLVGWFQICFIFTPIPVEMIEFDEHIFKWVEYTN